MDIRERYQYDVQFRHLVDMIYSLIQDAKFTPTEIRERAMLAQVMHEEKNLRKYTIDDINQIRRID